MCCHQRHDGVAKGSKPLHPVGRPIRHARAQDRGGFGFPLDVADRASARNRQTDAKVEPADTGAQAEAAEGGISHTYDS